MMTCAVCTGVAAMADDPDEPVLVGDKALCERCATDLTQQYDEIAHAKLLLECDDATLLNALCITDLTPPTIRWRCPRCSTIVVRRTAVDLDAAATEHLAAHEQVHEPRATPWLNRSSG